MIAGIDLDPTIAANSLYKTCIINFTVLFTWEKFIQNFIGITRIANIADNQLSLIPINDWGSKIENSDLI